MIAEKEIEKACDYIRDNAPEIAQAKANRIYLEEFRKSKKAMLIQLTPNGTAQSKEAWAYSHPDYLTVLQGLKDAVEKEECLKWLMLAAQIKIEVWRSQESTARAQDKAHY